MNRPVHNPPTGAQIEAVRATLFAALDPRDQVERELILMLTRKMPTPSSLFRLGELVERAVREQVAAAYDRGYDDGRHVAAKEPVDGGAS